MGGEDDTNDAGGTDETHAGGTDENHAGETDETRERGRPDDASERRAGPTTTTRRGLLAAGCAVALGGFGGFGAFESLFGDTDREERDAEWQDTETTTFGNDTTRFFDNGTTFFVDPDDRANRTYTTYFFGNDTEFFGTYTTDFLRTAGRRRRRRYPRFRTFTTDFRRRYPRRYRRGTTVTFDDGFEPADDPSGAGILRPPVTFSGRISPAFDVDYFQFFARRGEQIVLDPLTITGPLIWSFYGPNIGLLTFALRRTQLTVQNTGYQYLRIESRGNQIGRYAFRLWVRE